MRIKKMEYFENKNSNLSEIKWIFSYFFKGFLLVKSKETRDIIFDRHKTSFSNSEAATGGVL